MAEFFLTAGEMAAAFVAKPDYVETLSIATDTAPAAVDGIQTILVDTSGGPVLITLEDPSTAPSKYSPKIVNVGGDIVTVGATINGIINPTITTIFGGMDISIQDGDYRSSLKVQP